ncbi:glutamate decarboxylase [Desulfotomaculum copahuensis]|uniref:Glutamate decarboxylase n=1 Tax=Desulfotomaculum copahuensis TaxID=1838280 RepID=A0A1B7LGW8_9FIRM|nr:glutamate decarboxylase [Desulfotomaculum copahuensis]OAT85451.1 glutamate decarboxylase [Desulfotomaculum copahuensis]
MWAVVYIAPNRKEAERMKKVLSDEGLLVKLRELGQSIAGHNCSVEVLVPESEVDEALDIINAI